MNNSFKTAIIILLTINTLFTVGSCGWLNEISDKLEVIKFQETPEPSTNILGSVIKWLI